MIDYGGRGREAVVDPEITGREVVSRVASGEYRNVSFHEIAGHLVADVTEQILSEALLPKVLTHRDRSASEQASTARGTCASTRRYRP